jgi:hypothetical protein
MGELAALAKWLPAHTTLVLSNFDISEHLDASIEDTLLRLGIDVIYVLDGGSIFVCCCVERQKNKQVVNTQNG